MQAIKIRTATNDDLATLLEFEQGIIIAERPYDTTLKPDPISYYNIESMIAEEETEVIVATIADQIIASAYIKIKKAMPYLDHDYFGYLGFMYVRPEYRGNGVNKLIIDASIVWAKKKNLNELKLDVYDDNVAAIRAYEKAGFKKYLANMRLRI